MVGSSPGHSSGSAQAELHGLYWLAVNLAREAPLLLAVDDLHWADEPSLRWLAYLARRLEGLPILLLPATRVGDRELVNGLVADAQVLRPQPLGDAATRCDDK